MLTLTEEAALIMATVNWVTRQMNKILADIAIAEKAGDYQALERLLHQLEHFYNKIQREDKILEQFARRHKIST